MLWAPWRMRYIRKKNTKGCVFCRAAKSQSDKKNYVVLRSNLSISILNLFPYNSGHLMVSPRRHINDVNKLSEKEIVDLFRLINKTKNILDRVLKPEGYNIGINIGKVSGAGIAGHLHIHIVPRWKADTNFMPVVFNTKVVSQSLKELYKSLIKYV